MHAKAVNWMSSKPEVFNYRRYEDLKEEVRRMRESHISRAELLNRLAEIKAPPEANEYKAEVYKLIQSM